MELEPAYIMLGMAEAHDHAILVMTGDAQAIGNAFRIDNP
jgi:hypothetical protein